MRKLHGAMFPWSLVSIPAALGPLDMAVVATPIQHTCDLFWSAPLLPTHGYTKSKSETH